MLDTLLNMDLWVIAAFMGAALVLYVTPGADMMFTLASGISGGPKAGIAAAIGISTGVLVHTVLAAAGLAVLIATSEFAFQIIKYSGAAYLLFLAWKSWHDEASRAMQFKLLEGCGCLLFAIAQIALACFVSRKGGQKKPPYF